MTRLTPSLLIAANDYQLVGEVLDDERQQRAIRKVALRSAIGRTDKEPRPSQARPIWLDLTRPVRIIRCRACPVAPDGAPVRSLAA
jgi:hypothetical protein